MTLRYWTAGESHGKALLALVDGFPAGVKLDTAIIDYVKKEYKLLIGSQTSEEIKLEIGSAMDGFDLDNDGDPDNKLAAIASLAVLAPSLRPGRCRGIISCSTPDAGSTTWRDRGRVAAAGLGRVEPLPRRLRRPRAPCEKGLDIRVTHMSECADT